MPTTVEQQQKHEEQLQVLRETPLGASSPYGLDLADAIVDLSAALSAVDVFLTYLSGSLGTTAVFQAVKDAENRVYRAAFGDPERDNRAEQIIDERYLTFAAELRGLFDLLGKGATETSSDG